MSKVKDIDIIIAAEEYAQGKPNAMALSLAFKMAIKWYREQEDSLGAKLCDPNRQELRKN